MTMPLDEKDTHDLRLARPVAVVDLWEAKDSLDRMEKIVERLEKTVRTLVTLYHEERVKSWELILKEMMRQECKDGPKQN